MRRPIAARDAMAACDRCCRSGRAQPVGRAPASPRAGRFRHSRPPARADRTDRGKDALDALSCAGSSTSRHRSPYRISIAAVPVQAPSHAQLRQIRSHLATSDFRISMQDPYVVCVELSLDSGRRHQAIFLSEMQDDDDRTTCARVP